MDLTIIFLFAAVIIIGGILLAVINLTKRVPRGLDVDKYRVKWLAIEQHCIDGQVASYHLSVLNADKLVDQALRDKGIKGETMGERMKNCSNSFSDRNGIWNAHKLRNRVAHETDVSISYKDTKIALAGFKRALKDLGAI